MLTLLALTWTATARADEVDLCRLLRTAQPDAAQVVAQLEAGADADATCRWTAQVPMIETFGGLLFAVLVPPIGIPLGLIETVPKTKRASPLELAVGHGRLDLAAPLLAAGATPYPGAVDHAVRLDAWDVVGGLVEAGASGAITGLPAPLAGDVQRLERAVAAGVTLDQVDHLGDSRALRTDPAVAMAFVDAGLRPDVLLPAAAHSGGRAVVEALLPQVDVRGEAAFASLKEAVHARNWALITALHEAGVPLEHPQQGSALCTLLERGTRSEVARMLALGADPEARSRWGRTPVELAAARDRTDLVALLLEAGASPDPGLPAAITNDDPRVVDQLLDAGADPAQPAVLRAVLASRGTRGVQRLLDAGVDPASRLSEDEPWTVAAVRTRRTDVLAVLVAAGAPIDGSTAGDSPLQEAIGTGRIALVRDVLALGADPAALPDPPAAWAKVAHANPELFEVLVAEVGLTPPVQALCDAAFWSDGARVQRLLGLGVDPDGSCDHRRPVEQARDAAMRDTLIAAGARPTRRMVTDQWRAGSRDQLDRWAYALDTPLPFDPSLLVDAARTGDADGVAWLLDRGADPSATEGGYGASPLWHALEHDDATVQRLLDAGADASSVYQRQGLLQRAIEEDRLAWLPVLVEAGAALQPDPEVVLDLPIDVARFHGTDAVDALLALGHPRTPQVVLDDAWDCDLDRLQASRDDWPEALEPFEVRAAGRKAGCGREVRRIVARRPLP